MLSHTELYFHISQAERAQYPGPLRDRHAPADQAHPLERFDAGEDRVRGAAGGDEQPEHAQPRGGGVDEGNHGVRRGQHPAYPRLGLRDEGEYRAVLCVREEEEERKEESTPSLPLCAVLHTRTPVCDSPCSSPFLLSHPPLRLSSPRYVKKVELTVVPFDFDVSSVGADYDGLFLSNGPGDPTMVREECR